MFNQQELQVLIGGVEDPIDIDDLRASAQYSGAYDDSHETIRAFWSVSRLIDACNLTPRQGAYFFARS